MAGLDYMIYVSSPELWLDANAAANKWILPKHDLSSTFTTQFLFSKYRHTVAYGNVTINTIHGRTGVTAALLYAFPLL